MNYEKQKTVCADYAQENGGTVADVLRTSGRKGAAVISKDGRILYDPFVMEPVREVITKEPMTKMEEGIDRRPQGEISATVETHKPAQKRKPGGKKK